MNKDLRSDFLIDFCFHKSSSQFGLINLYINHINHFCRNVDGTRTNGEFRLHKSKEGKSESSICMQQERATSGGTLGVSGKSFQFRIHLFLICAVWVLINFFTVPITREVKDTGEIKSLKMI